jgi:hypothetical protein
MEAIIVIIFMIFWGVMSAGGISYETFVRLGWNKKKTKK